MTSNSQNNFHDQEMDNYLAEFADRVMDKTVGQSSFETEMELQESDKAEIAALEETILRFHAAVKTAQPNPVVAKRIEAHVKAEWKKPTQPWWKSWLSVFQPGSKLQAALVVAVIVIGVVAVSLIKPDADQLAGTAIGFPVWALLLFIGIVIVIFVIFRKNGS